MNKLIIALAGVVSFAFASTAVAADAKPKKPDPKLIKRGEYLVNAAGGCGDCHSPKTMTPEGPVEDKSRALSGHPAEPKLPPPPKLAAGPWAIAASGDLTAWSGPWGVTYTRNITPDKETGIGDWTEQNFIDTLRTGKRMGKGRPIMPPMPIPVIKNMTDEDLKAIYAYLMSIPPIKNAVPEPELAPPPGAAPAAAPAKDAGSAPAPAKK
jgi:mono/diheme cytochrome c family protein